ncbi:hypothetical protein AB4259_22510 [Vibrio amylolyticus]|uniref:hypothetical protein n=1 Tax=Vibrio amylolyticus TaxID=2847292 RepID=UPI003553D7AC
MFLFKRTASKIAYSFKASLLSASVAFALVFIFHFFIGLPDETPNENLSFSFADAFGLILFAPLVETILLVPVVLLAKKLTKSIVLAACLGALFFSILHSMLHPIWGLFTFAPFVVFCIGFQVWHKKPVPEGARVAFLIHAFHNSYVIMIMGLVD